MGEEYRAKVFKSGNSLALRLPKALGFEDGAEMIMREEQGKFIFAPADAPPRKIDLTGIAGTMPWLQDMPSEDFDDPPRDWDLLDRKKEQ
ncbi:MAG: AbrB/MazE/SpoVT family DNA-binding domain-containing protein [Pseudomonadota bacterium]